MKTTHTSLGARASGAAEEALEATTHALDSGRQLAAEAAGRIAETARELRHGAAETARELRHGAAESVSDATAAAQRRLEKLAKTARHRVADEPMKSVLVAAAVGAAAALLVMAVFRGRDDTD